MRKFRDKKVKGWVLVVRNDDREFIAELNDLMDEYDFIDCQYAVDDYNYSALVLIAERSTPTIISENIEAVKSKNISDEKLDKIREKIKKLSKDLDNKTYTWEI